MPEISEEQLHTQLVPANKKKDVLSTVVCAILCVIMAIFVGFRFYMSSNYMYIQVSGSSMENTLKNDDKLFLKKGQEADYGDVIVVDVRKYKTEEYKDIIVTPFSASTDFLIKRLIAKEHDKVKCENGVVYICYAGTSEYVPHPCDVYIKDGKNSDFGEYVVQEGEVFFLGDNRLDSVDSRYNEENHPHIRQLYKKTDIIGVVTGWSMDNPDLVDFLAFLCGASCRK